MYGGYLNILWNSQALNYDADNAPSRSLTAVFYGLLINIGSKWPNISSF